jgi:uncharacterized protein
MIFDMKFGRYYHRAAMLEEERIDSLQFARDRRRMQGRLAVAALPALEEYLFDDAGDLDFALTGFIDGNDKLGLDIEVQGNIGLVCQRCLGRLGFDLVRRSRLLLAGAGEVLPPIESDAADIETLPADAVTSVPDLVEQEVLLALPIAPHHPWCAAPVTTEVKRVESPFAVLVQLKRKPEPN